MTKKQETLRAAEQLVRDVLVKDFGQRVNKKTLREVAMRVARAIPVQEDSAKPARSKERVAATASGNEPYADERICPTCGGRGHVSADPQPTASFEARRDAAAKAIYAVEEPEFGPDATDARGYPRWGNYYEHAEAALRAADRAATDALAPAPEAKGNGR